jgi:glucosamine kinase
MTADVRLSLDAGQTSIRFRIRDADGTRDLVLPGVRTDSSTVDQVAAVVEAHAELSPTSVAVGLSGFDAAPDAASRILARSASARRVVVAHDSVTGYLGANGDAQGAVAAIGTGVVVLGVGPAGVARVDGWGYLVGDAGSAYWLGREGLDAALRSADGRGPATSLAEAATRTFGPVEGIYLVLQADPDRAATIAAFARTVTGAAEAGDAAAREIVARAAGELARSITAALARAGADPTTARVSATGKVAAVPVLRSALELELERRLPPSGDPTPPRLAAPLGEPIDGVDRLHELDPAHPLSAAVVVASR